MSILMVFAGACFVIYGMIDNDQSLIVNSAILIVLAMILDKLENMRRN